MKIFAFLGLLGASTSAEVYFKETFGDSYADRWVVSDWKESEGTKGTFVHSAGKWYGDKEEDKGIRTSQDAKFYATSAKLPTPFNNENKNLVLQFSVKNEQKLDCGGGYIKLFPSSLDQKHASGDSDYNIMFGPDICGSTSKVHVIFNYKGKNKETKKSIPCEIDQFTHVYTLIVMPDNTYKVLIDGVVKESGNLEEDFGFLEPKRIKDPSESKPEDWVDNAMMDDPTDKRPEGYDQPKEIADPDATQPSDWDEEDDGEWEAPMIDNPKYKGEWKAKQIDNPDYKGVWVHPEIDNPDYVEDKELYKYTDNAYVGFDLWQVKAGSIFDNIMITDDVTEAEKFLAETYTKNIDNEKKMYKSSTGEGTDEKEEEEEDEEEGDEDDDLLKKEEL